MGSIVEKRVLTVVILAVVMAAGFYIRVDDYGYWQKNKGEFFFKSESLPVAINPDAYYYIDIADEYLAGKIRIIDERRQFPTSFQKPISVPLLSFAIASISKLTDRPVEWVAIFLPVFCGIILAIPLYFLGFHLTLDSDFPWRERVRFNRPEAKLAGLTASLLALLSPALVMRSSVGWCDTDMLHVSFVTISVLLAIMIMKVKTPGKAIFLQAAWTVNLFLFLWWWDFAFWPATFLAGFPWIIAQVVIVLNNRHEKRNMLMLVCSGMTLLVFSMLFSSSGGLAGSFKDLYNYVFEVHGESSFPIAAQHVSEQGNVGYRRLVSGFSGGIIQLIFSLAGLVLLFFLAKRKILVLLPLMLAGFLAVSGERFMIFNAPLFGLGGATIVLAGWRLVKDWKAGVPVAISLIFFLSWGVLQESLGKKFIYPRTRPALFEGMKEFSGEIADDAVVWASWGHGHPLVHYTKKRTIGDGVYHPASLLYIQNFPLAASSFQLSANWISFYVFHGEEGLSEANLVFAGDKDDWAAGMPRLQELLAAGPEKSRKMLQDRYKLSASETEDLLVFLYPPETHKVYLLLDYMYLRERWYFLGKWNLANGRGPKGFAQLRVDPFMVSGRGVLKGKSSFGGVRFDLKEGVGRVGNNKVNLIRLVYEYGQEKRAIKYPDSRKGFVLYANKNVYGEFCMITDFPSESVFLKLFFEKKFDQDYFRPVKDRSPLYLLCEVTGDRYVPGS